MFYLRHFQRLGSHQRKVQKIQEYSRSLALRAQKGITFYKNVIVSERQDNNTLKEKLIFAEARLANHGSEKNNSSSFIVKEVRMPIVITKR
jgi:hypothetical protein